jgi:hypothetical protein
MGDTEPTEVPVLTSVLRWLLDSDPSIRWQVMRDLTREPADVVAAERAKVATQGWGARLLALQGPQGHWGGSGSAGTDANPEWITILTLQRLRDLGLDPDGGEARRAVALARDNVTWHAGADSWHGNPLFAGEVEPCINGRVVTVGSYFGQDVQGLVDRLLGEQMADGGWNCDQERGSTRGSFHSTICVLEGLREHQRATGGSPAVAAALERGEEYLLERRLLRRLSTGEVIDPAWTRFSFPTGYHYDVLRGLEYLRDAGVRPDARMAEAIDLVASKRDAEGRWPLETVHPFHLVRRRLDAEEGVAEGQPSRWSTLRALRVLDWYSARG